MIWVIGYLVLGVICAMIVEETRGLFNLQVLQYTDTGWLILLSPLVVLFGLVVAIFLGLWFAVKWTCKSVWRALQLLRD